MVKPKCLNTSLAGPDAPNDRMPSTLCAYLHHPSVDAASTASTGTPLGKVCGAERRRVSRRWGRGRSTRCGGPPSAPPTGTRATAYRRVPRRASTRGACARRPAPPRRRCSAALPSRRRRSRAPGRRRSAAGGRTRRGAPLRATSPRGWARPGARAPGPSACLRRRVRGDGIWGRRAVGEWRGVDVFGVPRFSRASMYEPDTSFASAGRSVSTFGVARRLISASTGWCVGPSSPRPIESCVATKITPHLDSADTRIAPSAYPVKLRNVPQNGRMAPYLQQGHGARLGRRGVAWGRAFPSWRRTTPARCKSPPWRAHARRSGCTSPRASPPGSPLRPSAS